MKPYVPASVTSRAVAVLLAQVDAFVYDRDVGTAATVLAATGINVLELEDSEIESVARALVAQYAEDAVRLLGQGGEVSAPADSSRVYRRIRELLSAR